MTFSGIAVQGSGHIFFVGGESFVVQTPHTLYESRTITQSEYSWNNKPNEIQFSLQSETYIVVYYKNPLTSVDWMKPFVMFVIKIWKHYNMVTNEHNYHAGSYKF